MNPLETRALYDLSHTLAAPLLEKVRYPWEALSGIGAFIAALGPTLSQEEYASPRPGVWIHKTAVLAPTAFVGETVIIGPGAEVRHGAFIRVFHFFLLSLQKFLHVLLSVLNSADIHRMR